MPNIEPMEALTQPINHILWDWNGTLLDDLWLSIEAINVVLDRYRLPRVTVDQYLDIFTFPVKDYYRRLGFDFSRQPFEVVGTEFIQEYTRRMEEPRLRPGARSLLERIRQAGWGQSLLSAAKQEMLTHLLDFHALGDYFVSVIGQDNHYAHGKSDAGRIWMESQELTPDEVLFIGDTLHDLDVAEEMGVLGVVVTGGHTSTRRLLERTPYVFASLGELERWLFSQGVTRS